MIRPAFGNVPFFSLRREELVPYFCEGLNYIRFGEQLLVCMMFHGNHVGVGGCIRSPLYNKTTAVEGETKSARQIERCLAHT